MRRTSLRPSTSVPHAVFCGNRTQHNPLSAIAAKNRVENAHGGPESVSAASADGRRRHVGVIASEHRGHPMSPPPPLAIGPAVEHLGRHTVCIRTLLNIHVRMTHTTSRTRLPGGEPRLPTSAAGPAPLSRALPAMPRRAGSPSTFELGSSLAHGECLGH